MHAKVLSGMPIFPSGMEHPKPVIVEVPELNPQLKESYEKFHDAAVNVQPLERVKFLYVKYILARCGGNITHAANALGVSRRQIQRWSKNDFR